MDIAIKSTLSGAKEAEGLTVVVDVFRAFTTLCYAFNNGAEGAIAVKTAEEAFELKGKNPDFILMGEDQGIMIKGFDYGNSPADIEDVDFTGKTIIIRTTAGTQGLLSADRADEVITGSFVNASAIAEYIKSKNPEKVTIVAMGDGDTEKRDEDELCAQYLESMLLGEPSEFKKIAEHLRGYKSALKFFDPARPEFPKKDFELCMAVDKFSFVLATKREGKHCRVMRR